MNTNDDGPLVAALKKYKVVSLLLGILVIGVTISVTDIVLPEEFKEKHLLVKYLPLLAVGEALISASVIGAVYEWFVRKESDRSLRLVFEKSLLGKFEQFKRDFSVDLIRDPEFLGSLTEHARSEVLRAALRGYVGHDSIANEVERAILPSLITPGGYWKNLRIDISLTPDRSGHPEQSAYMDARMVCEYQAIVTRDSVSLQLDCESRSGFSAINFDTGHLFMFSVGRAIAYDWTDQLYYGYSNVSIDDEPIALQRTKQTDSLGREIMVYSGGQALISRYAGRYVRHTIELKWKVPKRGHYFTIPVIRTVVGYDFTVRGSGDLGLMRHRLIPSLQYGGPPPLVTTETQDSFSHHVSTRSCVFAGSGTSFSWNLEKEYAADFFV